MSFTLKVETYAGKVLRTVVGALAFLTVLASFAVLGLIIVGVLG